MLQFVTVFNPSFSTSEDDAAKQLLLFHSFQENESMSLNNKLTQLGMVQALWRFSGSFADSEGIGECVQELDNALLCTIIVEKDFFITIAVAATDRETPATYVLASLRKCYNFFVLQYGSWSHFESSKELTDCLNEVLVPFWTEINLVPSHLCYKGFLSSWPEFYKVAELEHGSGQQETVQSSWEADLKEQILLDDTSFLGIQDVLVYHLPKSTSRSGYKTHGLVRNFTPEFDSLPCVSNWIEHLDTIYTRLSSHVIAGNVQYKEISEEEMADTVPENNEHEIESTGQVLMNHGKKIYHNFTLPMSFAYDAVQEVGTMTGVSSSMALLTDLMPKLPSWGSWTGAAEKKPKLARSEFLISPLSADFLPDSYKVKKLYLSYGGVVDTFNCLFWYYNEVLVVLIFKENFKKIWDKEYLHDTHFKLVHCISKLYASHLNYNRQSVTDNFCYASISKKTKQIKSSFPLCKFQQKPESASPLELVVSGLDEFLTLGPNRKTSVATLNPSQQLSDEPAPGNATWGLSLMGSIFRKEQGDELKPLVDTFLDYMPAEKLQQLHLDIVRFINTLTTSKRSNDIKEEKLIKLNNGILCFLCDNSEETIVLVENWFNKSTAKHKMRGGKHTLVGHMGPEAYQWWKKVIQL
ncbi:LADA_0C03598g1_1 [Lachancea dasiensis]|uniref:LADA_0C03598g1_1 n=1 Tax=Lachancea dasiensis TaxID=1072105 RepID=A0A1G4IYB8_9SACH|nr:LADA_0C03598g1_1 [Lachancea dasiensis]